MYKRKDQTLGFSTGRGGGNKDKLHTVITIICAMIMMCEPEVNHNTLIVS